MQQPTMPDHHNRWYGDEQWKCPPAPGSVPLDEDDAHERWEHEEYEQGEQNETY